MYAFTRVYVLCFSKAAIRYTSYALVHAHTSKLQKHSFRNYAQFSPTISLFVWCMYRPIPFASKILSATS
jgi:hypothetical protein